MQKPLLIFLTIVSVVVGIYTISELLDTNNDTSEVLTSSNRADTVSVSQAKQKRYMPTTSLPQHTNPNTIRRPSSKTYRTQSINEEAEEGTSLFVTEVPDTDEESIETYAELTPDIYDALKEESQMHFDRIDTDVHRMQSAILKEEAER